jgi:hypothetical protein
LNCGANSFIKVGNTISKIKPRKIKKKWLIEITERIAKVIRAISFHLELLTEIGKK